MSAQMTLPRDPEDDDQRLQFLPPPLSQLDNYDRSLSPGLQPHGLQLFVDAMKVREEVFVHEQNIPLGNEFDADDPRSCHWVLYEGAPPNRATSSSSVPAPDDTRDRSLIVGPPIGTIRLVPFPHAPHPDPGSSYAADALETAETVPSNSPAYVVDRATTFHDGKEPYIKLGRLCLTKNARGKDNAVILISSALRWAKENADLINAMVAKHPDDVAELQTWKGLVCVHAQVPVVKTWVKSGFHVDEVMGSWMEEGIQHVGMFLRLDV